MGDGAAEGSEIARNLKRWFAQSGGASLERPNGWFGRPFDNLHQLTRVRSTPDELQVELDGQHMLTVRGPIAHRSVPEFFQVARFDSATFRWIDDTRRAHDDQYTRGSFVFHHVPGRGVPQR